jgi:hypothetical protein
MSIINVKSYKQVQCVLKKSRKEQLYNVEHSFPMEIKDVDISEINLIALQMSNHINLSETSMTGQNQRDISGNASFIIEYNGKIYKRNYTHPIVRIESSDITKAIFKETMDLSKLQLFQSNDPLDYSQSKITEDSGCLLNNYPDRFQLFTFENKLKTIELDDIKEYINDNQDYVEKILKKQFDTIISIDGYVYTEIRCPEIQFTIPKNTLGNKEKEIFYLPFFMSDIADSYQKRSLNDLFVYDLSYFNNANYGKIIFDTCFGNGLNNLIYNSLGDIHRYKPGHINSNDFIINLQNKYSFGKELQERIEKCKLNNYNLDDVLNAVQLIYDNQKIISKKDNKIAGALTQKYYISDMNALTLAFFFAENKENVIKSAYKDINEKDNIFIENECFHNSDIKHIPELIWNSQKRIEFKI